MKNKTLILILSVLAVALYTVAVINFSTGDVLSGIGHVLMASSDALMAYSLVMLGRVAELTTTTANALAEVVEMLSNGVPAKITVNDGKETIAIDLDDDIDDDDDDTDNADDGDAENTDDNESGKKG